METILFSILVGTCLFSAFVSCALGFFVLAKNTSSRINRLFFAMMIGSAYWALGEYLLWTADSAEGFSFWLHASAFWPVVVAIAVYFILNFAGRWPKAKDLSRILHVLLFVPALLFSLAGVFSDLYYAVENISGIGRVYVPAASSPEYLATGLYVIVIMFWATAATAIAYRRAELERIREQNRLVCGGLVCLIVCGALSGIIFPGMGIYLPNLVFIGSMIFAIFIVFAIRQYGLFAMSPEMVVPEILKTLPDGVVLTDPSGRIIIVNAAAEKILGVSKTELAGQEVSSFLTESVYGSLRSRLVGEGAVADFEVDLARPSCSVCSISGTAVRQATGRIAGFVFVLRDISDRKAAEVSLRIANEKITVLSQMTRHDIGNLLTALSAYLDLLKAENANPGATTYLDASAGIVEKISRHLQFSREYQEIGNHEPAWQQLEWLVMRGLSAYPANGIVITVDVAPVEILTDPLAFKVIYNLFENSVRHGGHVTRFAVSSKKGADGSMVIVFEDDGTGVKAEDKQRIFEYGYGSHTGIGLSLSRDILVATGITIAETGVPGKGARFEICVPAAAWRSARVRTW